MSPGPARAFASRSNPKTFKTALNRLGSDQAFRDAVEKKPELLTKDYHLSIRELSALRQAAVLSGADMTAIDATRINAISDFTKAGNLAAAVDVNVSCCCCCCCGETAVVATHV